MDQDPQTTFELLSREAERFEDATAAYEAAETRTRQLGALTDALDAAFGALELAARLRVLDPDRGAPLSSVWRDIVLGVHRSERELIDGAVA
jgi:hypothetical protein